MLRDLILQSRDFKSLNGDPPLEKLLYLCYLMFFCCFFSTSITHFQIKITVTRHYTFSVSGNQPDQQKSAQKSNRYGNRYGALERSSNSYIESIVEPFVSKNQKGIFAMWVWLERKSWKRAEAMEISIPELKTEFVCMCAREKKITVLKSM